MMIIVIIKYHAINEYICYSSCLDIPGGLYIYELKDNSCSTTKPTTNCEYFYIKENGIIKCAELVDCKNINYFYLYNFECKRKCDDINYKLSIVLHIDSLNIPFFKCFDTPEDCLTSLVGETTRIYYNRKYRQC